MCTHYVVCERTIKAFEMCRKCVNKRRQRVKTSAAPPDTSSLLPRLVAHKKFFNRNHYRNKRWGNLGLQAQNIIIVRVFRLYSLGIRLYLIKIKGCRLCALFVHLGSCSHFILPISLRAAFLCSAAIQKVVFDYVCVCIQFLSQFSAELQLLRRCK